MQSALAVKNDSPNELRRYEALLDMADLMVGIGRSPSCFMRWQRDSDRSRILRF
jgi:hypothetical protein